MRRGAVKCIYNQKYLAEIAKQVAHRLIRHAVISNLVSQYLLVDLVQYMTDNTLCPISILRLNDEPFVIEIVKGDPDEYVCYAPVHRIQSQ